ncbi:Cilia- and flagella-associated protein 54 [Frankliniella fusca]|uniref:Cilia- and flagella-associated protein 54 n=1 Tax=Frankliniella fusca TaxID=407009 RepID=A0AAE1LJF1_9NEOP|nr:Cilia- and flagella-associated protein 54 [Frankliniella fusca]
MDEQNTRVVRELGVRRNSSYFHINDGFHYSVNRISDSGTIYFLCVHRRCPGRAVWDEGGSFRHTQAHAHHPNPDYPLILRQRRNIVERARTVQYVSFRDIVNEERRRLPNHIATQFTYPSLRSAMQRSRGSVYPNIPESLAELAVILSNPTWRHLTATLDLQDNLFCGWETASDGSQVVLFASERCLEKLRLALILFADGTFYITPSINGCYQVFAIVTVHNHTVVPLAWFLMERKSEAAYIAALSLLRAKLRHWNATLVICDYEDAMMNAFRIVLAVDVQGCLFHSAHAISYFDMHFFLCFQDMAEYARVHIGVIILQNYPHIKMIVEMCCALPLLPHHLLQRGFNAVVTLASQLGPLSYLISTFLNYIQREWLNHSNRGQTMSVSGSCFRTNNASESNNRRMKRRIGVHHPNIYQFIRHLADFESTSMADFDSLLEGFDSNRARSSSAISNDRYIQDLTNSLLGMAYVTDQDLINYLYGFSTSMRKLVNDTINPPRPRRHRR